MITNGTHFTNWYGILKSILSCVDVGCSLGYGSYEVIIAKRTKKQKFEKIKSMTKYHGEVVVIFKDGFDRLRRRKVSKQGHCYVSYQDSEGKWTEYSTSCFILDIRGRRLTDTVKRMEAHDRGHVYPVEVITKKKVVKL